MVNLKSTLTGVVVFLVVHSFSEGLQRKGLLECGAPFSRGKIVGGMDSGGFRYPWFALLLLKKNAFLPIPVCAGTLITALHVVTAAHCFSISTSVENQNLYTVALGVYDICKKNEATREIFNVESVAVHEKYQKRGKFFDIALIKLDRPAGYNFICLPVYGVDDITEVALLIGFGVTEENSNFVPCQLLQANVTKFSKKDCLNSNLPSEDKKEPSVICAGSLLGDVDSCYGDSGGPLMTVNSAGRYVIAGIVSYGYGCGTPKIPGIYTNVGSFIPWIQGKISTLGSRMTNITKKDKAPVIINSRRRGNTRRPNSGVSFSDHKTATSYSTKETPPMNIQYFDLKRPTLNTSTINDKQETHSDGSSRSTKKGSGVVFPV